MRTIKLVTKTAIQETNFPYIIDNKTVNVYNATAFKAGDEIILVEKISEKSGNPYWSTIGQIVQLDTKVTKVDLDKELGSLDLSKLKF